jgi:DHA1 family bicyclomycin/chloramphenicol resistance-like MFS transporter
MALSAVALDPFLPALPRIVSEFGATVKSVQLTVTAFFIGLACGQLFYGTFSDHYGRRPMLLGGLALCLAATIFCANAGSVDALVIGRFFQALGVSSASVLCRSVVRDLNAWDEAAQKLAVMWVVFGLAPVFGPYLGSLLLNAWGWPAIFWCMAAIIAPLLLAMLFGLPETAPYPRPPAPQLASYIRNFVFLLSQRHFAAYLLAILCIQTAIFAFVTNSSFVLITALGFSPGEFGLIYGAVMAGHVIGAAVGARTVRRRGINDTIRLGALISFAAGALLMAFAWAGVNQVLAITVPVFFMLYGSALIVPHAMAAAMSPYPEMAGAASSLVGIAQLLGGAVISYVLGVLFDGTPRPLATAIALSGLAVVLVDELLIRRLPPHTSRAAP